MIQDKEHRTIPIQVLESWCVGINWVELALTEATCLNEQIIYTEDNGEEKKVYSKKELIEELEEIKEMIQKEIKL